MKYKYVTFEINRTVTYVVRVPKDYSDEDAYNVGILDEEAIEIDTETNNVDQEKSTKYEIELFHKKTSGVHCPTCGRHSGAPNVGDCCRKFLAQKG